MKRYLWISTIFIVLGVYGFTLMGCGMTKNNLLAEQSYYEAMVKMQEKKESQLLFRMSPIIPGQPIVITNGTMEIFAPPQGEYGPRLVQYQQKDYVAPWLNFGTSIASIAAPWIGAAVIATNVASSFKDVAVHSQPGNTTNITAGGNAMTGGTMTQTTSTATTMSNTVSGTRNTGTLSGVVNQTTSTPPLIVTQPAPVIVTQPAPIVVTQPPPVVVNPSYPPK
jgi:hypothetical protein